MTDDEVREQLALAAAGALPDAEWTALEEVLRTRPDLRAELVDLEEAAALLAAATQDSPPPALRARVLDAIAHTPQVARDAPAAGAHAPVVPLGPHRRRRFVTVSAVAAATIAIVAGVLVASPWNGDDGSDLVAAVVTAADAQRITMPGELGELTIVHSPTEDAAVLLGDGVPIPDRDRVYELWAIRDGTPRRAATFLPDDDGSLIVYAAGLDPASADQWAITEEPPGGSDTPTTPILNATA